MDESQSRYRPDLDMAQKIVAHLRGMAEQVFHDAADLIEARSSPAAPLTGDTPRIERELAEHRDNGRRLMEAADGWKAEAERLRGVERALEDAQRELVSAKRDADHFYQLSGRYLEELNGVRSAKTLISTGVINDSWSASGNTIRLEDHYLTVRRELAAQEERLQVKRVFARGADGIDEALPIIQIVTNNGVDVYVGTPVRSTTGLVDEAGKFFDWGHAASGALRNLLEAYERRIRSLCTTPEELAAKPWECAEYLEARRVLVQPDSR